MTNPSKPESSSSNRIIIIGAVVIVLAFLGYCAKRVASLGHTFIDATNSMVARMDTTHHVASGSAVYIGDTKVADIVGVIVIHADTSTPTRPTSGRMDSTIAASLRGEHTIYTAATPDASAAKQLNDLMVVGQITGAYDDTVPVRITVDKAPAGTNPALPTPVQLKVPGRQQSINVY